MLSVMYMKNNILKTFIAVIALVGYGCIFSGAKQMRASVIVTFIFCWTAFVLGVLFAFSPEIKRLVFRKDRLELERYKQQVNKALVEYDEFKKTIAPLLKITLSQIAFNNYLGVPAAPEDLIEFLQRVDGLSADIKDDESIRELIRAVRVKTIEAFNSQLVVMRNNNGLKLDSNKYISITYPDFSEHRKPVEDDVAVDFNELEKSADKFQDLNERERYKRKINQLKKFYQEYFE